MKVLGLSISILLLCFAVSGQQTGSISGTTVMDGKPVSVPVTTHSKNGVSRSTRSDQDGRYIFSNLPPGRYEVVAPNATVAVQETIVIRAGQNAIVDLNLTIIRSSISENVTVAAGANQPIEQVSKTVDVISAQELRDRADFSLADTLRTIPGFRVQQFGGFGRTATIKARGLRNQDTAILIDGIRFRDPSAITGDASPFISDITLTSVSKIEVLRGSGSSLYGTNAIGGVVDFQTPRPPSGTHGQLSGAIGGLGLGRFRGNISHGTSNGNFGINAGFSQTAYTKGIDGDDNSRNTNLQTRVEYKPFWRTNISGRIFFSNAKVRLNANPDTLGTLPSSTTVIDAVPNVNFVPDADDPDAVQRSRFFNGQVAVDHAVNDKLVIAGYYQGSSTRRRNDDGPLGPGYQSAYFSIFDGSIHTANIHATWTPVRQNTLVGGYEFERESYGNEGGTPSGTDGFFGRASQKSNTIYVQNLVRLFDDKLQVAGGFRMQNFSLQKPSFSSANAPYGSLTLSDPPAAYTFDGSSAYYIARTGTKLRVHIGNGYRVPSLYERFGTYFFFGSFYPLGNPDLKPERSIGYDGGVEQFLAGSRVKLSATYFYTEIKDEISYLPTDDFGAPSYYNFDRHFSRGVEFSASVKAASSTDVFASYTYTNSDVRNFRRGTNSPPLNVASSDRKAYGIPDHEFTLVFTQRFKRFWVNLDLLATSSYLAPIFSNSTFGTYIYRFAGNRRGDLTAGYTFRRKKDSMTLRLYGTVENIFAYDYYENGFRTTGRTGRIGLTFGF